MEVKSISPEIMICMCLPKTGVGTRLALTARSQMKELTGYGLDSVLQRVKKDYFNHKYSQKEPSCFLCRKQLKYRHGLLSQKSG